MHRRAKFKIEQIKTYQERGVGGLKHIFYENPRYDRMFEKTFETYTPGEAIDLAGLSESLPG